MQDVIAENPEIVGIGDVALKEREKILPGAGRLDLLFQGADDNERYEVEVQLGATDETHIIRTIEYWDIERKRYPQYNHTAVIIAEEITGRFFNVISLFNGSIPIMAIQVTAVEQNGGIGLLFTKILDTVTLGGEDEEEMESTDRNYWENTTSSPEMVALADQILEIVKRFAPSAELSYNRAYIGFWVNGKPCNFATCALSRRVFRLRIALPKTDEEDQLVERVGFNPAEYNPRSGGYRRVFSADEIKQNEDPLRGLLERAYKRRS